VSQISPDEPTLQLGDRHQTVLPMRWGDADVLNHMNNTVYFRLMEEARMQWLWASGETLPAELGFILAHASCDFVKPLTYPCDVRVTHVVTRVGNASLETDLLLEKVGDDRGPYARARTVMVWIDYETGSSVPMPQYVLQKLAAQCTK
jgi:acyl-CoA thioester hydrolase